MTNIIDDDREFIIEVNIPPPPPRCEDYTTQEECEAHGCYWYNNSCHSEPPPPPPPPSGDGFVVGGSDNSGYLNITEKYNASADIWTNKTGMTIMREGIAGFSINNYGYIIGGYNGATLDINERYDPISDTWNNMKKLSYARNRLSSFIIDNYGFAVGGSGGEETGNIEYYRYNERYDPTGDIWVNRALMSTRGRDSMGSFSLLNYGYIVQGYSNGSYYTASHRYDNTTDTWVRAGYPRYIRIEIGGFAINGYGYLSGGGMIDFSSNATEQYDPIANGYIAKTRSNDKHYAPTDFIAGEQAFMTGGYNSDYDSYISTTEQYDDMADIWSYRKNMNTARYRIASFTI